MVDWSPSTYNTCITPAVQKSARFIQNGFIKGRQLVGNIVTIDTFGRLYSDQAMACYIPIFIFWDFAAAFPSAFHRYLLAIVEFIGAPGGFCNIVRALYSGNKAFARSAGGDVLLFTLISGVLQGCPLSGTLFGVAVILTVELVLIACI